MTHFSMREAWEGTENERKEGPQSLVSWYVSQTEAEAKRKKGMG